MMTLSVLAFSYYRLGPTSCIMADLALAYTYTTRAHDRLPAEKKTHQHVHEHHIHHYNIRNSYIEYSSLFMIYGAPQ
jgi:hypothetical protein